MTARLVLSWSRRRPYGVTFGLTAFAVVVCVAFVDLPVLAWTQSWKPELRTAFNEIARLSAPGVWIPVFVVGAGVFYALNALGVSCARRWFHAFAFGAASTILAGIALNVAKFVFGRLRPKAYLEDGAYGFDPFSLDFSMNALPSGHTQAAVTLAVVLIFIVPRYDLAFVGFGALIAACRVIHANHWVGDVIAGAWLGAVVPIAIAAWMAHRGWSVCLGCTRDGPVFQVARWAFVPPVPPDRQDPRDAVSKAMTP